MKNFVKFIHAFEFFSHFLFLSVVRMDLASSSSKSLTSLKHKIVLTENFVNIPRIFEIFFEILEIFREFKKVKTITNFSIA